MKRILPLIIALLMTANVAYGVTICELPTDSSLTLFDWLPISRAACGPTDSMKINIGQICTVCGVTLTPVTSVYGRTGTVTAQAGDYTFAQLGSKPTTIAGFGLTDAAPKASKYIVQGTSDSELTGAQFLGALASGILKNTTSTGVLARAIPGTDYAVSTSGSSILKGDGMGGFSSTTAETDYSNPLTFNSPLSRTTNAISLTTVGVALGGTGITSAAADAAIMGGGGTSVFVVKAMPTGGTNGCSGTLDKLLYNTTTHAFSCGADQTAAGGSGITTLNTLTDSTQTFAVGTTGTDFTISSATATHTFNIPTASASNRGLLSTSDWTKFNGSISAYPGAGIGVSTGSAWGTSKATPSGVIVGTTDTQTLTAKKITHAAGSNGAGLAPLYLTSGPVLDTPEAGAVEFLTDTLSFTITTGPTRKTVAFTDSNITGTASNVSGTPALPNGTTATTQSAGDNSTKIATTSFADALISDTVFGSGWNGVTGIGPSKNAVYDQMVLLAPLAGPTFTGTVTVPTPFTIGAVSMTATGTQLNYLNAATGTTGTASTNLVFSASPTFTTQIISPLVIGATGSAGTLTLESTSHATKGKILFGTSGYDEVNNRLGIGQTTPTAALHLKAGTTTASTAPLKFTSGSLLTTAEAGAVEFLTDAFYGTITTGAARKTFAFLDSNITGTAANVSGTPALPNGTTGTTQAASDNSTKLATTAYVDINAPVVDSANGGTITARNGYHITTGATTWTLPATTPGYQHCFRQADAATNAISITPPTSSYVEAANGSAYCTVGHAIKSGGANGDSICYVAIDTTHWMVFGGANGSWTCQ